MMHKTLIAFLTLMLLAARPEAATRPSADDVVGKLIERTALGFDAGSARLTMQLQAAKGEPIKRQLEVSARRDAGLRRYKVRFLSPADVEGTTLLFRENGAGADSDVYLYLPAFKRVRRIAAAQKNGAFMGSDFTYADMEYRDVKAAKREALADESIDGIDCYHLVATPSGGDLYGKLELWVRKDSFLAQQIKFFDKQGQFSKAYRLNEAKLIDGRWVATRSQMWSKGTGHTTYFQVESLDSKHPPSEAALLPENIAE
jgi:uncharacterized protein